VSSATPPPAPTASQQQGPKVLRVGLVQGNQVAQVKVLRQGESVTVGESPKATFKVSAGALPRAEYPLFVAGRSGYVLNFTEKMSGKISSGSGALGLDKLRADPNIAREQGSWRLPLTEADRGSITIDGVTVLFQFVPPPPATPMKSVQSMDFRPPLLQEDDPVFLGFLSLWGALASVLLVIVATTEPSTARSLDDVPERYAKILLKPPEEPAPAPDLPAEAKAEEKAKEKSEEPQKAKEPGSKVEQAKARETLKQDVRQSSLLLQVMTTRGENRSGVYAGELLSEGDAGLDDLGEAVKGVGGAEIAAGNGLREGDGGDRSDADIGALGGVGAGGSEVGAGPAVVVRGDVDVGDPSDLSTVGDAGAVRSVVKEKEPDLLSCYEQSLKTDPALAGRVEVEWFVRAGRVTSAGVFANTTRNAEFAECIVTKIKRWRFPEEVDGEIIYPFVFRPKS